jgi:hypothetical protein
MARRLHTSTAPPRSGLPSTAPSSRKGDRHSIGFEILCESLALGASGESRAEAAGLLYPYGSPAVEPLCRALKDRDHRVRAAAAESLGRIGDERAVGPLTEALRECLTRRSRGWHVVTAVFTLAAAVAAGVMAVTAFLGLLLFLVVALGIPGSVSGIGGGGGTLPAIMS